jgi:hypothetical protein
VKEREKETEKGVKPSGRKAEQPELGHEGEVRPHELRRTGQPVNSLPDWEPASEQNPMGEVKPVEMIGTPQRQRRSRDPILSLIRGPIQRCPFLPFSLFSLGD